MGSRFDPARPGPVVAAAVVAGVAAGLAAALFLTVAAEPSVEDAIRLEQAAHAGAGEDEEIVSRSAQKGVGLFAAYTLTGVGFGLLFAATFVLLHRNRPDVFRRALLAGALLAGALTLSPWVKYPPNPPAVGDPGTLAERQWLYLALIVLTAALLAGAAWLSTRLRSAGWDEGGRVAAVAGAIVLPLLALYALLPPPPDPVPVPATLLWRFRVASLGGNLVLWAVLTLGFGMAAARRPARTPAAAP